MCTHSTHTRTNGCTFVRQVRSRADYIIHSGQKNGCMRWACFYNLSAVLTDVAFDHHRRTHSSCWQWMRACCGYVLLFIQAFAHKRASAKRAYRATQCIPFPMCCDVHRLCRRRPWLSKLLLDSCRLECIRPWVSTSILNALAGRVEYVLSGCTYI